jgi:hypothetical protein
VFILKELDLPKLAILYYQSIEYPRAEILRQWSGNAKHPETHLYTNNWGDCADRFDDNEVEELALYRYCSRQPSSNRGSRTLSQLDLMTE